MRTFVFENLDIPLTAFLSAIYLLVSVAIGWKIMRLHEHSKPLNTQKLFLATLFLSAVLRFMCFGSIVGVQCVKSKNESRSTSYDDTATGNEDFFEKAEVVMFDFPDFCFVSGYVLLLVIWGESYIRSRRHYLSRLAFRRAWFYIYLVLNIIIYSSQIALYSLLFVPRFNKDLLSKLIFLTLTVYNLLLPLLWIFFYIFLLYTFAGFPFASVAARDRLSNIFLLGTVWTASRVGYGIFMLTSLSEDLFFSNPLAAHSATLKSIAVVSIFLFFEVFPILLSLRSDFILSLASTRIISNKSSPVYKEIFRTPMVKGGSRDQSPMRSGTEMQPLLPHSASKTRMVNEIIDAIKAGNDLRATLYGSIPQPSSPLRSSLGIDGDSDSESDYNKTIELDESLEMVRSKSNSLASTFSGSFKSFDLELYKNEGGGSSLASMSSSVGSMQSDGYFSVHNGESP